MALSGTSVKRRASVSEWFKQLLVGQEQQGTAKAAASAYLATIYGLRAASRLDGNKEWGRVGDDMISCLEQAYLDHMGNDGAQAIELGRRLLRTDEKLVMPKPLAVPRRAVTPVRVTMPKLPHLKDLPHIKSARERLQLKSGAANRAKARMKVASKAKVAPKPRPVVKVKARAKVASKSKGRR